MNAPSKALKITVLILRTLMGLLFLLGAAAYFAALALPHSQLAASMNPPMSGDAKTFMDGLMASRYLMPTVKVIELVCGLAFVSGRFAALAAVLIAPIIVNILLIGLFLEPSGIPVGIFLVLANGLVAYAHRDRYAPLFQA